MESVVDDNIQSMVQAGSESHAQFDGVRLGFLIHDVSRLRRHAFDSLMKPFGITRAQWWVLAHLSRHDGMMQTQLADILDVGKASLGTVLERLEKRGLIERRGDPVDRRAKRIFLSKKSRNLIEQMVDIEYRFNDSILADLSHKDVRDLLENLQTLKANLSKY